MHDRHWMVLLALGALWAPAGLAADAERLAVVPVDIHERLFPDRKPDPATVEVVSVPRGATAAFQFAVTAAREGRASVSVSPVRREGRGELRGKVRIHALRPVHVEGNTQGNMRNRPGGEVPEGWAQHQVRGAPFDTLEVLEETDRLAVRPGETRGILVEVPVPADAAPGDYSGRVRVTLAGESAEAGLRVRVHRTALPPTQALHSVHWLWPEPHNLKLGAAPEWWSPEHWRLLENSGRVLRRFGDDTLYTPLINYPEPLIAVTRKADGSYTFDYRRFDRWVETFSRLGYRYFAGHHILNLPDKHLGGVIVRDERTGKHEPLVPKSGGRDAWLAFLPIFYDSLSAHLAAKGWTDRYLQHQYDEPKDQVLYGRLAEMARKHLPGVRTIDAVNTAQQDRFSPLVDVQVFNLLGLNKWQGMARERRAQGRGVWLYHCTSPYPPYPNRHLDSFLAESRLYPWLCFHLGADGYLYWGANIYRGADEYRTSIGPFPNGSQDPGHPPGDNWFCYRGPDGLRPSMRLLSFREGMVDHALLALLAERDAAFAKEIVGRLVRSLTDYERRPAAYHAARGALLERLDAGEERAVGKELVRDPRFRQGFTVWRPEPGKKVVAGRLRVGDDAAEEPVWGMAQWTSRFPFESPEPERLPGGAVRFANAGKVVVIAPPGSADADLALRVNASAEYEHARRRGEPWPHLLVEQTFKDCPTLQEMKEVRFHLEARLRHSRKVETPDYSRHLHAAQFLVYFTVQNLNRRSPGYGDYYWFGIPVYDDRSAVVPRGAHGDAGTGKLIFSTPGDRYATANTHGGKWVTFEGDLLPEMLDGLRTAWERGFLKDSRDLADYRLGGMNMGWEVPGIFDVEVQTRNLSVRVLAERPE